MPKPNLGFISKWEGPPEKSSYVSEFALKRSNSTPLMSASEPETALKRLDLEPTGTLIDVKRA